MAASITEFSVYDVVTLTVGVTTPQPSVTFIFDNNTSWQTNVFVETSELHANIETGKTFSFQALSTCTTTPSSTSIIYTMNPTLNSTVPAWISLNTTSGYFEGTAPYVRLATNYSFILSSSWQTNPAGNSDQVVTVTVTQQEYSGYDQISIEAATVSSQTVVALSATTTVGMAAVQGTSFTGFYLILHQLQMIMLFLTIDSFIPKSVESYLEGQSFALVTFNFISSKDIPFLSVFLKWLDSAQEDQTLSALRFESTSTFVNHFTFLLIILAILTIHFSLKYLLI